MTRVKGGSVSKTRRRKVLKEAKGYFGSKHRLYKTAAKPEQCALVRQSFRFNVGNIPV